MADLITNLQSIYNTKLQIKEAIGTDSDIFADYPSYISDLKPAGYTYITMNGDHSVNGYAYVNVAVPGATEYDHIDISANSQVDVSAYNYAYVSVPVPPGYIIPEGTINIETVGTHDVTSYASAYVDIQVPTYVFGYQTITNNGVAYASSYGLDGFTYVDVNVSGGGGSSHSGDSISDAWTVDEAISYIQNAGTETVTADKYVKGFVKTVQYTFSSSYPTCRVYIVDDPDDAGTGLYLRNFYSEEVFKQSLAAWDENTCKQIQVGDFIVAQGTQYVYYQGTQAQMMQGHLWYHKKTATGQLTVSQSGTYDVQNYVSAYVDVQGGEGYPETTYSLTGYVLDSTRLLVNNNAVNISNGDYLELSYSYNLGQEITLPNCVQVYADRFIESMGGNVSNVFWFDNNNTITYTGNTYTFTYTGNITLNGYGPIETQEKNYWYDQYPQKEIRLYDDDGNDYYITDSDYRKYIDNSSSIRGLTANISYITDNYSRKFATINSISPVQYTGFMYESIYGDPSTDVNFTSETIDGHTGLSCSLALQDPTLTGGELVGGGVVKATLNGSDYFDIQLDGLNIDDGTTLSYEQRYFGKFGTSANLNVGWYDDVHTCESMKLFIYLDDSTWVAKYIWTLN